MGLFSWTGQKRSQPAGLPSTVNRSVPPQEAVLPGDVWVHYRGSVCTVVAVAESRHDGTEGELFVVYQCEGKPGHVFCRPLSSWQDQVLTGEPRFRRKTT